MVSARDLGLISERQANAEIQATLTEVSHLQRYDGFLYQWYDTTNGDVLLNPGQATVPPGRADEQQLLLLSNVDNGWYASGLIVVREAMPELATGGQPVAPMNFGLFYDNGPRPTAIPTRRSRGTSRPARCLAGTTSGCRLPRATTRRSTIPQRRVLQRPADLGLHRHGPAPDAGQRVVAKLAGTAAAGAVRRLPEHRPGLLLAGPVADGRSWQTYTDPQSGQQFPVWEGHYTYPGRT